MSWEMVRLGDVCKINPPKQKGIDDTHRVSFIPMQSVSEITKTIVTEEFKKFGEVSKGYTSFGKDDVLLAKITPCFENGKVAIADIKNEIGFGSSEFHVFRPNDVSALSNRYIFYLLQSPLFVKNATKNMTGSAGQKRVPKKFLETYECPLPPLEEQHLIVDLLDRAQALIDKRKEQIALMDQLIQSLFYEMFGDPVTNPKGWGNAEFGKYVERIVGGKSVGGEDRDFEENEFGVLKISSVTSGTFDSSEFKVVEQKQVPDVMIHPQKGDLLFSRANTREMVGATCIVDRDCERLFLPDKLWRIDLLKKSLNNYFVKFLLSHDGFRENLRKVATGTSGSMLNISKAKLLKLIIPTPPINIQNTFAERVQQIETQKQAMTNSLKELQDNFNALSQRAFKGELTQ